MGKEEYLADNFSRFLNKNKKRVSIQDRILFKESDKVTSLSLFVIFYCSCFSSLLLVFSKSCETSSLISKNTRKLHFFSLR